MTVVTLFAVTGAWTAPISTAKCVLPRPPSSTSQGAPDQTLLSMLGVLRRRRKPSDSLSPRRYLSFNQEVFVRYIRRARVVAGVAYYVIPALITRCEPDTPYQGIDFLGFAAGQGGGGGVGENAADIERYGDFGTSSSGRRSGSTVSGVVPDGVASVTLQVPADGAALPAVTVTARVVENVVVFASVPRSAGDALQAQIVWRRANGTVIKTVATL